MLGPEGTSRNTSTGALRYALGYALVGFALSLVLHVYYVARWDHYAVSISARRMAQLGGNTPEAHIAGTKLSARDGAVMLLVSGVVVALIVRRFWLGCSSFAAGAAMANVALGVVSGQIRGNLWPLGVVSVLLLVLVPIAVGSAVGGGLRMLRKCSQFGTAAVFVLLLVPSVMRCASAPAASPSSTTAAPAAAELSVVRLLPELGTTLTRASIIEAAFNYRLSNAKSKATYTLQPGFGDRLGAGYTFNSAGPADVITLTSPGGTVEMRYPVIREWTNKRLARPIEIWFQIIETEQSRGKVLAEIGPYRYAAAPEDSK